MVNVATAHQRAEKALLNASGCASFSTLYMITDDITINSKTTDAGVDPKTVQYLAGHENSKTTMDIYAKIKYNKPEELLGVVNAAFGQQTAM